MCVIYVNLWWTRSPAQRQFAGVLRSSEAITTLSVDLRKKFGLLSLLIVFPYNHAGIRINFGCHPSRRYLINGRNVHMYMKIRI
jgi:hypothetical protein